MSLPKRHQGAGKADKGMEVRYKLKGAERKKLVQAVSELMETPANYKGAPSFAYDIGGLLIDKDGTISGPDNRGLIADLEGLYSLIPAGKRYDAEIAEPPVTDAPRGRNRNPDADYYANGPEVRDAEEAGVLAISLPLEGFNEDALNNLDKLVASKASLIRKAVGADALPILQDEGELRFPWFSPGSDAEEVDAYTRLVAALCELAKTQKRVTAREKETDNEKFAFRVFLIRLGFIGDEFKLARKILMKNLSGNSAFKNGAPQAEAGDAE